MCGSDPASETPRRPAGVSKQRVGARDMPYAASPHHTGSQPAITANDEHASEPRNHFDGLLLSYTQRSTTPSALRGVSVRRYSVDFLNRCLFMKKDASS